MVVFTAGPPIASFFEPAKIECLASHVDDVLLLLYGFLVQINLSGRSDVARLRQGLHEPVSVRRGLDHHQLAILSYADERM